MSGRANVCAMLQGENSTVACAQVKQGWMAARGMGCLGAWGKGKGKGNGKGMGKGKGESKKEGNGKGDGKGDDMMGKVDGN